MNYVLENENSLLGPARNSIKEYPLCDDYYANIMGTLTFLYGYTLSIE